MSPRPRVDRAGRRAELAGAAARVFAVQGVAGTVVSDIVKAAGVAQGPFYLYFDSKDDVVLAVAEQLVAEMGESVEASVLAPAVAAPKRLRSLVASLNGMVEDPAKAAMAELLHRPGNSALHDRLTEPLAQRLFVLVEGIVAQGVAEGSMDVPDIAAAAWFVLGGLQGVERAGTSIADMPVALDNSVELALRALGVPGTP